MGSRKVEMLKRTQWLAFALSLIFMLLKAFAEGGASSLSGEILLYSLIGVGVNFGAFVAGNVMGDHRKVKNDSTQPPEK